MKNPILLFTWFLIGSYCLHAQQAIPAAGGNSSGTGGSISYSVGQTIYSAYAGTAGNLVQGCQQPYVFVILTSLPEATDIGLDLFPNPSSDLVKLMLDQDNPKNMSYRLYNNQGAIVQEHVITDRETILHLGSFPSAPYVLHILKDNREIKSFIIIKN
jgi:hypothetical protein